jgi:hypothetical protein
MNAHHKSLERSAMAPPLGAIVMWLDACDLCQFYDAPRNS